MSNDVSNWGQAVEWWKEHGTERLAPKTTTDEWGPLPGIKDSGERVTYASGSMRDPSTGKIKWSRITFGPMMRRWAQHLTTAEAKYPDVKPGLPNFMLIETEEERIRYKESAFRHFMAWFHDETDEDHAAAVFFNVNGVEIIKDKRGR
jgi:dATP/dGTP diphosphohydrolase